MFSVYYGTLPITIPLTNVTALKLANPNIELILCGKNGYDDWDRYVLQECCDLVDMHSIQLYTYSHDFKENVTAPLAADAPSKSPRPLASSPSSTTLLVVGVQTATSRPRHRPRFASTSGTSMTTGRRRVMRAASRHTTSLTRWAAIWLNVFIRQSKHIGMANLAQSVNVLGPISTGADGGPGLVRQTLWWPLLLFSKYMRGKTLGVHLRSSTYEGPTFPDFIRKTTPTPWLDVSCAYDEAAGFVNLAVVNVNDEADIAADLDLKNALPAGLGADQKQEVQVFTVGGGDVDVKATNFDGVERVGMVESTWATSAQYTFPKHSFTLLRWSVNA